MIHLFENFNVGDMAVYPAHGVADIIRVETKEIAGNPLRFYHLQVRGSGLKIIVPISKALEAKFSVKEAKIQYLPKNKKSIEGRDAEIAIQLADLLDDHDDVQSVFADFDVSDEELARIAGA